MKPIAFRNDMETTVDLTAAPPIRLQYLHLSAPNLLGSGFRPSIRELELFQGKPSFATGLKRKQATGLG